MPTSSDRHQQRKISKRFPQAKMPEVLRSDQEHNKSERFNTREALTPKTSLRGFDVKRLETFSLGDFVELLEAAELMPTGRERVLTAEELLTTPIPTDSECIAKIRKSRFCFLVEHLYSGECLIRDLRRKEKGDDVIAHLYGTAVAGLINFLMITRALFYHILELKRGENRVGRSHVPTAETGQELYAYYIRVEPVAWRVDSDGRLASQPFREIDPSRALVERLLKLLSGSDPARIRRCAFVNCGKVFYAQRIDQLCCSRRCNNNRLQREWYQEHGKSAVYVRASRRESKR
jgi:hypothetical protein